MRRKDREDEPLTWSPADPMRNSRAMLSLRSNYIIFDAQK